MYVARDPDPTRSALPASSQTHFRQTPRMAVVSGRCLEVPAYESRQVSLSESGWSSSGRWGLMTASMGYYGMS